MKKIIGKFGWDDVISILIMVLILAAVVGGVGGCIWLVKATTDDRLAEGELGHWWKVEAVSVFSKKLPKLYLIHSEHCPKEHKDDEWVGEDK